MRSPQDLYPAAAGIHVKEVILQDYIRPALDLDRTGIGFSADNDLITLDTGLQFGAPEAEMLRCAEQNAAAAYDVSSS